MTLELTDLRVRYGAVEAVRGIDLSIAPGRTLGLVGESGSGKSATALAVMGLVPASGSIRVEGRAAMVFQEPVTSLNPVMRVGAQVAEAGPGVAELFDEVGLPRARMSAYPHELSGGQCQRVMIAMALARRPALLVADEPTTALDPETQAQILRLLKEACRRRGMSMLFVSHDLDVVAEVADEVAVMRDGRIVGRGLPARQEATVAEPRPLAEPVLEVEGLRVGHGTVTVVEGLSFHVARGRTLALVGESGCGKTTVARAIPRLIEPWGGSVRLAGVELRSLAGEALRLARRKMPVVFQDPMAALDPRIRAGEVIDERAATEVGLSPDQLRRFPHELSGGQRQRVCIARALATEPALVILDEPTSALDASSRGHILQLLRDLQARRDVAYLLISHDRAMVRAMADEVVEMPRR